MTIPAVPLHYSVSAAQGKRAYMEDTYCVTKIQNHCTMFAVFDGHGGACAARYCAQHACERLKTCIESDVTPSTIDAFVLALDEDVRMECPSHCGTTALFMFADNELLRFANCGDSMAMVLDKDGGVHMMSHEHKVESEKERIQQAGGLVTYHDGVARIFGQLNLSRALGDADLKDYVISDPYLDSFPIHDAAVIIMASDGLWDVYKPTLLHKEIRMYQDAINPEDHKMRGLPSWLIHRAINLYGSTDNITVIVVCVGDKQT